MKTKAKLYQNRFVICAFFCSMLIMGITYIIKQIYPFGDQTILRVDLFHQYAPYLEELRSRILNGESLLYSWEGGLGKDFVSQMAYYTASPFSFLILFFPQESLPEAVALLILLKTSLCASSFAYYLKSNFQKNDLSILFFGLLYAFCAFMTCYYWNIMWLDTVYLFPFVALGTERLVQEDKQVLYYLALTFTMIVNFYLAVLVCILTAGYFLVVLFSAYKWKTDRKVILGKALRFALVSILCALSSMFILAPVAVALGQTATSEAAFPGFELYQNIVQLFTNHFLGARPAVLARNEDLPNIYSGVLTLMLLPIYFFNTKIPRREKILMAAFLAFMLLCSCIKPLDFLIHGLHFPANLPHRYTFVYSFVLLHMAYRAFTELPYCRFRFPAVAAILYTAVILVTEFVLIRFFPDLDRVLSNTDILLNLALMVIYLAILYLLCRGSRPPRKFLLHLLFLCAAGECLFSSSQNLEDTHDRQAYVKYMSDTEDALAFIEEQENGEFCRMEFRRFTTINDASLYHYNGFSQFSSLAPGGISSLIQNLGIAATSNSYRYYDPTPLIDAMFTMKYVLNKDEAFPKEGKYKYLQQFDSVWVYRNTRSLPLGFLVNSDITEWKTEDSQPFAVQNDFIQKATGTTEEMFTLIAADSISQTYMEATETSGPCCFNYKLTDPQNLSQEPTVYAEYTSDKDQYLYLYVDAANAQRFRYRNNTVNEDRELSAGRSLIDVGWVSAGEKIYVEFSLTKRGEFEKTYREEGSVKLYAASYDDAVFQKAYDQLNRCTYEISRFEDTLIEGTVQAQESSILYTSIPFQDGWEILVDGEPSECVPLGDGGLLGVEIPAGQHTVTFRYSPDVVLPSVLISLLGIVLFTGYCHLQHCHHPRHLNLGTPSSACRDTRRSRFSQPHICL